MQLSPLASEEGGNSAAGSRVSSAAAVEADDEVLIAQLREQLVARLRGGPQQPGNAEALACLQASSPTCSSNHTALVLEPITGIDIGNYYTIGGAKLDDTPVSHETIGFAPGKAIGHMLYSVQSWQWISIFLLGLAGK